MVYATVAELAAYLEVEVSELPSNSGRLLTLASELIDYATLNRVDTTNAATLEGVKGAVCSQVEYWMETGDPNGIVSQTTKMGFGSFSMDGTLGIMGPRVRQKLMMLGLLFRGIGQSTRYTLPQDFFKRQGDNSLI